MLLAAVLPAATHVTPAGVAGRELEGCVLSGCTTVATLSHPPGRVGPTAKTGGGRELGDKRIALGLPQAVQQRLGAGGLCC